MLNETNRLKALRAELAKARSNKDQISNKVNLAIECLMHFVGACLFFDGQVRALLSFFDDAL